VPPTSDRTNDALLRVRGLTKRFGGLLATDDLDLDVWPGELHALIGPNGAGKTTALAQIAGEITPTAGTIQFGGADISADSAPARVRSGLARTFQITQLLPEFTADDNVALAVQAHCGHGFRFWADVHRDQALRRPAREYLDHVGLSSRAAVPAGELSYGEQRQLELAVALASSPRLLMLDEPLAGLGSAESAAMVGLLRRLKGQIAILLIEHDMEAVFDLADSITVVANGRRIALGSPDEIRSNADVRTAYLGEE
jgi:branched-chain amino acid transport system ATP-binding protein